MLCNWVLSYSPAAFTFDAERGEESGALVSLVSDWGDSFSIEAVRNFGYPLMSDWCRAVDSGAVPAYLADVLPDVVAFALFGPFEGECGFQVDLATRTGEQTARELWILEQG